MMNYETTPKIKYGFETIQYSSYFWSKIECSMVADFDLSYPNTILTHSNCFVFVVVVDTSKKTC